MKIGISQSLMPESKSSTCLRTILDSYDIIANALRRSNWGANAPKSFIGKERHEGRSQDRQVHPRPCCCASHSPFRCSGQPLLRYRSRIVAQGACSCLYCMPHPFQSVKEFLKCAQQSPRKTYIRGNSALPYKRLGC